MIIGIDGNEANITNRVGVNQYASELLNALEKLPEAKKHEFIIYLANPPLPHMPSERQGWKYEILPAKGLWILRMLTPYLFITRNKPDVFFSPSHYAPPILPMSLVISIMDLGFLADHKQFKKTDYFQLKYWGALSVKKAAKIISISYSTKAEIEKYYPVAYGKVEVTHLGFDKTKFNTKISKQKIEKIKRKYGIKGDYLLFLSTLKPSKNVEGIIEAFSLLKSKDLKFVVAGKKGWLYETIFAKIIQLGLEDSVIFTDFVPEEDKPVLIRGAKAFLAPSFWEGFGIHVLEAMACGVPVVISNTGSLPEVAGEAAVMVNPFEPEEIAKGIEVALEKHDQLAKMSLVQAQKFSWEKTAEKTLQVLEKASV